MYLELDLAYCLLNVELKLFSAEHCLTASPVNLPSAAWLDLLSVWWHFVYCKQSGL